ncbi:hypothetical protein EIP91_002381 [Steccherinum ochraceum]|uniref:Uncharacterized protein n=1 Tax=Steccherinum ochraceum TaxID=92696 RepID=A0A4R0RP94_9APHY|nr:hypothetical protein EIP91_002381 [Steccherinum ochraceum]
MLGSAGTTPIPSQAAIRQPGIARAHYAAKPLRRLPTQRAGHLHTAGSSEEDSPRDDGAHGADWKGKRMTKRGEAKFQE